MRRSGPRAGAGFQQHARHFDIAVVSGTCSAVGHRLGAVHVGLWRDKGLHLRLVATLCRFQNPGIDPGRIGALASPAAKFTTAAESPMMRFFMVIPHKT